MQGRFVGYFRVSTGKQGKSGLGLEAQEQTVSEELDGGAWEVVGRFVEVETGTNKRTRPELDRALAFCRIMNARLIVANVSRLTRDPDFMGRLVAAGVEVVFCDLPNTKGPVGRFVLRQMLAVAELEAGLIAERTRKALAAAKARGVKLGGDRGNLHRDNERGRALSLAKRKSKAQTRAMDLSPIISDFRSSGSATANDIAKALNGRGIPAPRGGRWQGIQVQRVLERMKG